ncbi:Arabinose import ATP-binding protein AraG [Propionispora sp. 2/2-37]|uniref:sugar ABC transporter ATP-binding protein n=1 Tax=Propionispora sp. 2/2-37 TaxID=1677858 RepID=UPI0006BB8BCD|nr:sugar ABC transporter ATP-binding protein [Propionispora sp. 2/2-37]CUH94791.1 Arabinose import ATP-binding protein AraG [Propionispora sp. 2/2-37]
MKNVLEFKSITKYFPGVKALDDVSFTAEGGEVLAFLGENGAGKSTLLKVLNGDYQPTSGQYLLNGETRHFFNPKEAIEAGISVIYQERQILMEVSVAENIFVGRLPVGKFGLVDTKRLNQAAQKIIDEFGLPIDPGKKVKELGVAHQQMVEIMKAYSRELKVIAFDEPTASLCDSEIDILFKIIEKLKREGKIIIYVSHRMKELRQIADKVAIFKDGRFVKLVRQQEISEQDMIRMMVGRDLGDVFKELNRNAAIGEVLLEVKNLCSDRVNQISFRLYKGEILGFSGLVGAGRTEVMRAIIGADKRKAGEVLLSGRPVLNQSPGEAIQQGIVMVPEDRKTQGILPNMTVGENISISILGNILNAFHLIQEEREEAIIAETIKKLNIKTPNPGKKIVELSGGNQQKVILARWLITEPKVLILDEPTKGIDVGAKSEFYKLICDIARQGVGVLLISSELPEIIGLSDRIIIMKNGRITGEVSREEAAEDKLLAYAMLDEGEKQYA